MRSLTLNELNVVNGGISLGAIAMALAAGLITGGPAGLGIAAAGLVGAKGIDNLNNLIHDKKE